MLIGFTDWVGKCMMDACTIPPHLPLVILNAFTYLSDLADLTGVNKKRLYHEVVYAFPVCTRSVLGRK
jgi:hypothetical protein